MNPTTAMVINWVGTALFLGFGAWQTAGGKLDASGAAAFAAGAVGGLNGLLHGISTAQAGPLSSSK